jgi:hypothetical protein
MKDSALKNNPTTKVSEENKFERQVRHVRLTIYNFKRVMNIFKFDEFLAKLKKWNPEPGKIVRAFFQIDLILSKMTMPTNAVRTCALNY